MDPSIAQSAWKIIPTFYSLNVSRTVEFYTQTLGFELGSNKPEEGCGDHTSEPYFCSVFIGQKADANIYFHLAKAEDFKPSHATIALGTRQLDDFYAYLRGLEDVKIAQDLEDTEWGWRWFTVKDIDGNSLTFFKFLEGGNPGEE